MIETIKYVLVRSIIALEIQYAGRLTPETNCICLSCFSRSTMINEMIMDGMIDNAMLTTKAKRNEVSEKTACSKSYGIGIGTISVSNLASESTVANID